KRIALANRSRQQPGDGAADPETSLEGLSGDGLARDLDPLGPCTVLAEQHEEGGRVVVDQRGAQDAREATGVDPMVVGSGLGSVGKKPLETQRVRPREGLHEGAFRGLVKKGLCLMPLLAHGGGHLRRDLGWSAEQDPRRPAVPVEPEERQGRWHPFRLDELQGRGIPVRIEAQERLLLDERGRGGIGRRERPHAPLRTPRGKECREQGRGTGQGPHRSSSTATSLWMAATRTSVLPPDSDAWTLGNRRGPPRPSRG